MTRRNPVALTDAEEVVALTRIRVENLAEALAAEPIDRDTYAELAAFLEGPAWRACDALDELRTMSTTAVINRVGDVLARTHPSCTRRRSLAEPGSLPLPFVRSMQIMAKRYPTEQRVRANRMAVARLDEYGSAWGAPQALGPKLGVGPETLRKWVLQAQVDASGRPGPSSEELAEIKALKKENADFREANEILKAASIFFARDLGPRQS